MEKESLEDGEARIYSTSWKHWRSIIGSRCKIKISRPAFLSDLTGLDLFGDSKLIGIG